MFVRSYSIKSVGLMNYLKLLPYTVCKTSKKCASLISRAMIFFLLYIVILIILGIIK